MFRSSSLALLARFALILAAALPLAPVRAAATPSVVGPSAPARIPSSEGRPVVARVAQPSTPSVPALGATLAPTSTTTYTGTVTQHGFITALDFDARLRRYQHEATRLLDGTVLVTGGSDTRPLSSAVLYDPATGQWQPTSNMNDKRFKLTATLLEDGRVLVAGGYSGSNENNGPYLNTAELYEPATRTFKTTDSFVGGRENHTATRLQDGRVLITGGQSFGVPHATSFLFDPATETFTQTGSLNIPRENHTATRLQDGRVLVVGGTSGLNRAELYDPATGMWTLIGDPIPNRSLHTATLLADGRVLVVGVGVANVERQGIIFDPQTLVWTPTGAMAGSYSNHTATLLADGGVLVAGGTRDNLVQDTVELYEPATNQWLSVENMRDARMDHTATLLDDGSVLLIGGINQAGPVVYVPTAETYVPSTNTFSGSLTVPDGWLTATSIYTVSATTTAAAIDGGSINGRPRFDLAPGVPVTQTVAGGPSGIGLPLTLRLRDVLGVSVNVISATARYDFVAPASTITPLPTFSRTTFVLAWSGTDAHSGIADYDVQVRNATAGTAWTPLLSDTTTLSTTFTGVRGSEYRFRVRAYDVAGNTEAWPATSDAATTIDPNPPTSRMQALPTISPPTFTLRWSGQDDTSTVAGYDLESRIGTDGAWTPVLTNTQALSTTFTGVRGTTYEFRVRATDDAGNVEAWPVGADTRTLVDPDPPQSAVTALPQFSPATFMVRWTGQDAISGIAGYDLTVRDDDGAWTPILTATLALSTSYTGKQGHTYQFRVRATDGAGNVEAWPASADAQTNVDIVAPSGTLAINGGALATTGLRVTLRLAATDAQSGVADMRVAIDGNAGAWQPYQASLLSTLTELDGTKVVGVQFRDPIGNVSDAVTQTIRLDRTVEQNPTLSINDGAVYTTTPTVTLAIGAPLNTKEMQISNNGDFKGALWQPFDTMATWTLSTYLDDPLTRIVYVRTRDIDGDISSSPNDDIIFDPFPPEGTVTITSVTTSAVAVNITASDNSSRKEQLRMRLSTNAQFSGASWQPYQATATVPRQGGNTRVYAQFQDAAGNHSAVVVASTPGGDDYHVFLPLVRR